VTKTSRYLIIGITSIFLLLTILKSFYFSYKNGGTDLRPRIVGTRLMSTEHSPYFYKWKPADGEFFLEPNTDVKRIVNGNIVTPAVMYTIYPLAQLPYSQIRLWWTIFQLLAGLSCIFLVLKNNPGPKLIPVCLILSGLFCTDVFLLNIERGQIYVFYALIFSFMYYCYVSTWKYNHFASGLIHGLFIFYRPVAAIIGLGFIILWKPKWLAGSLTGFLLGCLLFIAPRPSLWQDYFNAMKEYNYEALGKGHKIERAIEPVKPAIIEGMSNLDYAQGFNISGLYTVHDYLQKIGININNKESAILFLILLLSLCLFLYRQKEKNAQLDSLFLFGFLIYILTELFMITPRGTYNQIQWLPSLLLIALKIRLNYPGMIILAVALLFFHNFPFVIPYQSAMAELIFIGMTVYVLYFNRSVKT
jgi:hypothetical protein